MTVSVYALDDPRRDALVRQARLHFVSEGYAGTKMEPIAREAGVSTATLYAMFDSKAALFAAVIDEASADFTKRMAGVKACTGPPRPRLTSFLTAYAEFLSDAFVRAIFRLVMTERHRFESVATAFYEQAKQDFGAVLVAALTEMAAKGELKVDKASWAASQLMGMVEHPLFFVPMVTGDQVLPARSPASIAEDAVETFLARYAA
ncbi:TetR/AcrR family transcriptional regulator [Brevundimonas naejangsanensis]|uniref:TetR/AcrR family transcriptional regulator n=1 Tax=Brevundimonas naejangsanensis TaxID=588932 RepID=A0A494RP44_9CAUL|nr:TetR/AcrR family transcriptional regulator [Brevundimonas naejangsanensis]AYG95812.1 TetR/AcrR family transcriptional regulator [Brevundimonas naejangsanensis]